MPGLDCNAAGRRRQGRDDLDQRRVGRADACMALVAQGKRLPAALIPILVLRSQQWTEPLQAEVGDRSKTQAGLRLSRAKALGRWRRFDQRHLCDVARIADRGHRNDGRNDLRQRRDHAVVFFRTKFDRPDRQHGTPMRLVGGQAFEQQRLYAGFAHGWPCVQQYLRAQVATRRAAT